MIQHEMLPCSNAVAVLHIVIAVFTGLNTLLVTWLTRRAVNKDKNGASQIGNAPDPN